MAKPIPDGFYSITPTLMFKDTRRAIEFYKRAFGAVERFSMPGPDGKSVMHAEITIGNSIIFMGDENPMQSCQSAETIGKSPVNFMLYLENVDAAFRKALEAGAVADMPVQEMFWGDRAGSVKDPFGYNWMLATHTRDLPPEEIAKGAQSAFAEMSQK